MQGSKLSKRVVVVDWDGCAFESAIKIDPHIISHQVVMSNYVHDVTRFAAKDKSCEHVVVAVLSLNMDYIDVEIDEDVRME